MELHHESFPQTAGIVTACSEGGHHQQIFLLLFNRLLVNPFLYPFPKYGEDHTYASNFMQKTEFMALRKQGKLHTLENSRLKL